MGMLPFRSNALMAIAVLAAALPFFAAQGAPGGNALPGRPAEPEFFARSRLLAWCIVPFDAKKRGPEERAAMLERLGLKQFAYDYRAEHVPAFDAELEALRAHGIELTAWWFPATLHDEARHILDVIRRHGVHPQLWVTGSGEPVRNAAEQLRRVETEAARIGPIATEAAKLGCKVALYNHGGWFGEPENQMAILDRLARDGISNTGMVYNLHHAHGNLERFAVVLEKIRPHLLALNLNGMDRGGDKRERKILPLGQGEFDLEVLRVIQEELAGWQGPIGILNHTGADAEARLLDNLDGLDWLLPQLAGKPAGPRPQPRSWKEPAASSPGENPEPPLPPEYGPALRGGLVVEGKPAYREPPLTVECRAKLDSHSSYNILIASDTKASGAHWELFTTPGSGCLTAYLPGWTPDHVSSSAVIADGRWHHLGMAWDASRVRLFVDGAVVADQPVQSKSRPTVPGGLAFGRLVEGGLGCDGWVDEVRLSRGVRELRIPPAPLAGDGDTLGLWDFNQLRTGPPPPSPAPFLCNRRPLRPEQWPQWRMEVNRDRMFDFYAKEARRFLGQQPLPALLPAYPGLDSGVFGHWGNQNEDTWRDGRWNQTDFGSLLSGVFRGGGLVVPKAVCVRLGAQGELAACFDTELLDFRLVWKGGFVGVDDYRHGFLNGIRMQGEVVERFEALPPPAGSLWRGFYRHGNRVIFSYTRDGVPLLDSAWVESGRFVRQRGPASASPPEWTAGGPAQWPGELETKGQLGADAPYAVDTLTLPFDNPWRALFFVGDHDFFPDGDLAVCTFGGDVWRVSGVDGSLSRLRWRRLASGLHQPLGLVMADGVPCVLGRDQITRLRDLNGDGEADFYECVANGYTTSPNGHDYICGLQRDAQGRFYFVSSKQGLCRIVPGGQAEVLATGFRNPAGLGLAADGTVTTSVQEGDWTPASAVCQIKPGGYYGYPGPKQGVGTEPPLLYLPRGLDNSCGGQAFVDSSRWGPLQGQLLHFSFGAGSCFLVLRETIDGQAQGAAVPLPVSFRSGAHRGRFSPRDGQLYVSGMNGWGSYTADDGCLQRVRYTGGPAQFPIAFEARENGVLLTFAEPLDPEIAGRASRHFAQCWNYRYSAAYGSPEYSLRYPDTPGHDPLEIASAHVTAAGRGLFLEMPALQPAQQIHLQIASNPGQCHDLFLTAHRLGAPYTAFEGYRPQPKPAPAHCQPPPPAAAFAPSEPNRWASGSPGRPIRMEPANGMQFATKELRALPGERISLTFHNPDVMPHNWALLTSGSLERVGDLVNKFVADPRAAGRQYVPESSEVLAYTDIVMPGGSFTIHFHAPATPGDYPYICTFPGHWQVMNGILRVQPASR